MRYLISLIIFFVGIIFMIFVGGGNPLTILDIPSLIAVGLFPFLFVSTLFGFKEMKLAFSISRKKEPEKGALLQALHFFKIYGKATWIAGIISVFIGIVGMLANLEDKSALGPNLALALISFLYSGIIHMVIIIPFTIFVKKKLKE